VKLGVLLLSALVVGGCATSSGRDQGSPPNGVVRLDEAGRPCFDRVDVSPSSVALMTRVPIGPFERPSPAQLANDSRPTAEEVRHLLNRNAEVQTCRRIQVEAYGKSHPVLVGWLVEAYVRSDERYLKLVRREITWGEAVRAGEEGRQENVNKVSALILQGPTASRAPSPEQRQQAAQMLVVWSAVQQKLSVQRKAHGMAALPAVVTCTYPESGQLQCT